MLRRLYVIYAKVNHWGCLESPFYKISKISKEEKVIYLFAGENKYHQIATSYMDAYC